MAGRLRLAAPAAAGLAAPGVAWVALAALLGAGALLAWFAPAAAWDWQPALAAREPWRCWSAAFVHWSARHLAANLAGCAVVAAFGWAGRLPWRSALAWALAWPLTQLALLAQPALAHYGGLSGVLHAGVAVAGVGIALGPDRRRRRIAFAVLGGLALKIGLEAPWGAPLRHPAGWDIAVAPLAHATGALVGTLMGTLMGALMGTLTAAAAARRARLAHRRQSGA